jgi:3'-5' exoribonuclease
MAEQPALTLNGARERPAPSRIRDLRDGIVAGVFGVRERERRQKRNGEDFLQLALADATGSVRAISWDEVAERHRIAAPGSVVWVRGDYRVDERYGATLTVRELRAADPDEYEPADLTGHPRVPVERLEADLRALIATVQKPALRVLLERFFAPRSPTWPRFRAAPAAKYYHQAYPHGLLDHTLSVAEAVSAVASAFPGIDRDIAVAGALLHDVGKTEAYNDDPLAIDLTDAGRLHGEIPLGYYLVRREIERIDGFDTELALATLHIVLSHHGTLENGSPVVPCTREATLVHAIDNLGGKLGSFDRIERELADGEAWSRFDRGIDASAYFASRAA